MKSLFQFLLLFIALSPVYGQGISATETRVLKSVESNSDQAIDLLKQIVNINSGTLNIQGVKEVGMILKKEFDAIQFDTRWVEMPSEMNRAGHLFAEIQGNKGKKLLLIGHLDTVFEKDSPFQQFKMVNDSMAHAPGGYDMKGGDIVILFALKALQENGLLQDAQIIVAYSGDEESSGNPLEISRKDLIDAAKKSDLALGFEYSTGFNTAAVARRGSSGWEVEVEGQRAHSSLIFSDEVGAGSIFELSRILSSFYEEVRDEEYLTFNPGLVVGGTFINIDPMTGNATAFGKSNVVSQKSIVKGGLRFISAAQQDRARFKMRQIVQHSLPHTSAHIRFRDGYPAMTPTEGNYKLLKELNQVSLDLGMGEVVAGDPGKRGAADVSFVAEYVDCLDGLGAVGHSAHTPEETVNIHRFEDLTKRTAILIYRLINQEN